MIRTAELKDVPGILRLSDKLEPSTLPAVYNALLMNGAIDSPDFLVLVEDIGSEISGYIMLSSVVWNGSPSAFVVAFVNLGYTDKDQGWKWIKDWCVSRGLYKLLGLTTRNPEAFVKRYGWKVVGTLITRAIEGH